MDSRLLDAFIAVVHSRSYSAAAEQLSLPKSTISRHVTELERSLGVRLLHRTTRRLNVTAAGQSLFERVEPLMASLRQALMEVPERDGHASGTLRVTASVDFGVAVLAPLLREFLDKFPNVSVDLRLTNEYVDIVKEGLDIALRLASRRLDDSSLQARRVGQLPLYLVASPQYLDQARAIRSPKDLDDQRWVRFRGMRSVRLEGPGGSIRLEPKSRLVVDDMLAAREAVRAGAGLGLLPSFTLDGDLRRGDVVRVLPKWQLPSTEVWLLWPSSTYVPLKVSVFNDFIAERLKHGAALRG
jgi:DNA-binding transcriptional LysR family regulator